MKISLILALLLISGIIFSPVAGDAQMLCRMLRPGHIEWVNPDGGQFVLPFCYPQLQKPLHKEQASQEVENYLKSTGNPNLKLGEIREKGENFEADVLTKKDSLVDKILVSKDTGEMRSEY